ncbi:MAG: hypothetical protein M1379_09460 [Firmicutes bacterium]|nr:hypothetical protein [Bacillota bacterium]
MFFRNIPWHEYLYKFLLWFCQGDSIYIDDDDREYKKEKKLRKLPPLIGHEEWLAASPEEREKIWKEDMQRQAAYESPLRRR